MRRYLHAVGHLNVVTGHRRRLLRSQPDDAVGDVSGRRVAILQAFIAVSRGDHQITEFLTGTTGRDVLKFIHCGEDRIDALGLDRTREQCVNPDAALFAQLQRKALTQRIQA